MWPHDSPRMNVTHVEYTSRTHTGAFSLVGAAAVVGTRYAHAHSRYMLAHSRYMTTAVYM